jgi:hypothetical protein
MSICAWNKADGLILEAYKQTETAARPHPVPWAFPLGQALLEDVMSRQFQMRFAPSVSAVTLSRSMIL